MTIIEPNKNRIRLNSLTALFIGLIVIGAVLSIFAYTRSVRLNYALDQRLSQIKKLRADNADLKNQLYAKLDFQDADELASRLGLARERKPEYLAAH